MVERPDAVADPVTQWQVDRDVCRLAHLFTQKLDAHIRRIAADRGLSPTQVVALRELSDPITARELATRMVCEASNATFVLDRLEQDGLIERRPHPTDRRAKQVTLTAAGRRHRAGILEELNTRSPLASLSPTQQNSLRDLLRTLTG